MHSLIDYIEREDATKESDFTLDDEIDEDDEENDWDGEVEWNEDEVEEAGDGDVADESAAYLEFLNKEAQKFSSFADEDDEDLDEESLLETPLDKVEPYGMFKHVFLSKLSVSPLLNQQLTVSQTSSKNSPNSTKA